MELCNDIKTENIDLNLTNEFTIKSEPPNYATSVNLKEEINAQHCLSNFVSQSAGKEVKDFRKCEHNFKKELNSVLFSETLVPRYSELKTDQSEIKTASNCTVKKEYSSILNLVPVVKLERIDATFGFKTVDYDLFRCGHCLRIFSKKRCLQYHILKVHHSLFSSFNKWKKIKHKCELCFPSPIVKPETSEIDCNSFRKKKQGKNWNNKKHAATSVVKNGQRIKNVINPAKRNSNISEYICSICDKSFKDKSSLSQHIVTHSEDRPFKCPICPCRFKRGQALKMHKVYHENKRLFKCTFCSKSFNDSGYLKTHTEIMHNSKKEEFNCHICGKYCKTKRYLKVHLSVHEGARPFKCPECPATFRRSCDLKPHLRVHSAEKPFKCPQCPKRFNFKNNLMNHIDTHDIRKYVCLLCNRRFKQKRTLVIHMKCHDDSGAFQCLNCPVKFSSKKALSIHARVHTDGKGFKCTLCPRIFTLYCYLQKHITVLHDSARNFVCDTCSASFKRKDAFTNHQKLHLRPGQSRKFPCSICKENFLSLMSLKQHLQSHTDAEKELLFECDYCKTKFSNRKKLYHHIKRHNK